MQARYCSNTVEEAFGKAMYSAPAYGVIVFPALFVTFASLLSLLGINMDPFMDSIADVNPDKNAFTAAHAYRLAIAAGALAVAVVHGIFGNPLALVEPEVLGRLVERVEKVSGVASGILSDSIEQRLLAGHPIRYLDLYAIRRAVLQRMPQPLNARELDVAAQRKALTAAAGAPLLEGVEKP